MVVGKSLAEVSSPISDVLETRSRANLPCLVKLALNQHFRMIYKGSCDTEDRSNDAVNSALSYFQMFKPSTQG